MDRKTTQVLKMNSIKKYRYLILFLLLICGQSAVGQVEPPVIISVTVIPTANNPGAVEINWTDNTRDSYGYIIFKLIKATENTVESIQPIDTVYSPSHYYFDSFANGNNESESYFIQSFIDIVNGQTIDGLNSEFSSTIYLYPIEYNSCDSTNTLTWNPYIGWGNEVYYTLVDDNGIAIPDAANLKDTVFIHKIEPGNTYFYSIIATQEGNSNVNSTSNQQSVFATPIKPANPANFYINNISYDGSTAIFNVNIDNTADLLGHSLRVSSDEESGFSKPPYKEIDGSESIEFSHSGGNQPLFYKVAAIDVCHDTVLETNTVRPLVLKATGTETEVTLSWNESYIQSTSEIYKIFLKVDASDYAEREQISGITNTYQLNELGTETSELFCFRIEAVDIDNYTSLSNEACVSRLPIIEIPNAFSPNGDGINDYFGPFTNYIKNVDLSSDFFEFKLIIYDKYGGAIYESDNVFHIWTGVNNRVSMKYVPEGGYIYYLWFKTALGKSYEKSGTVNVVYP